MKEIINKSRRIGSTEILINELCGSIVLGQPKSIVWVHNTEYKHQIKSRIIEELESCGIVIDLVDKDTILCAGCEVRFMTKHQDNRGLHGYGDFIDHYAMEDSWFKKKFLGNNEWSL